MSQVVGLGCGAEVDARDPRLNWLSSLCAPSSTSQLLETLTGLGFTGANYLSENRDLNKLANDAEAVLLHFCSLGILGRRRFKLSSFDRNIFSKLEQVRNLVIDNRFYKTFLQAGLGRALVLSQFPEERSALPAHCDTLTDEDISGIFATAQFGSRPFVVFGDSHSRLYARMTRILADGRWLLPINMTCSAGSARGAGKSKFSTQLCETHTIFFSKGKTVHSKWLPLFF